MHAYLRLACLLSLFAAMCLLVPAPEARGVCTRECYVTDVHIYNGIVAGKMQDYAVIFFRKGTNTGETHTPLAVKEGMNDGIFTDKAKQVRPSKVTDVQLEQYYVLSPNLLCGAGSYPQYGGSPNFNKNNPYPAPRVNVIIKNICTDPPPK